MAYNTNKMKNSTAGKTTQRDGGWNDAQPKGLVEALHGQ